jgi:hypothetical protein
MFPKSASSPNSLLEDQRDYPHRWLRILDLFRKVDSESGSESLLISDIFPDDQHNYSQRQVRISDIFSKIGSRVRTYFWKMGLNLRYIFSSCLRFCLLNWPDPVKQVIIDEHHFRGDTKGIENIVSMRIYLWYRLQMGSESQIYFSKLDPDLRYISWSWIRIADIFLEILRRRSPNKLQIVNILLGKASES